MFEEGGSKEKRKWVLLSLYGHGGCELMFADMEDFYELSSKLNDFAVPPLKTDSVFNHTKPIIFRINNIAFDLYQIGL